MTLRRIIYMVFEVSCLLAKKMPMPALVVVLLTFVVSLILGISGAVEPQAAFAPFFYVYAGVMLLALLDMVVFYLTKFLLLRFFKK